MKKNPIFASLFGAWLIPVSQASALTYGLAAGNENWPSDKRAAIVACMDEAVAVYNSYGVFEKHVTANYNSGVPTAQANYDGWIDFGGSIGTRVALHEISHTLGVGTYWTWSNSGWSGNAGNARIKLYEGQNATIGTGGSHFWPYGLNYDNEDGTVSRERHVKMVAAMRWDMGIVGDSDGDGMPDDWEKFHFGNLGQSGTDDADSDGVNNLGEYESDSNPNRMGPVSGTSYRIRAKHSNKLMEVADASTSDGADVRQWSDNGGSHQQWIATHVGGGWWSFTNANSGKVMEVVGMGMNDGDNVQQGTWTNHYGQQWRLADGGGGFWRICNRNSGRTCDVNWVSTADGATIVQWPDYAGDGQKFAFDTENSAPVFYSNPIVNPQGITGTPYAASLANNAGDPNGVDVITFTKTSGPAWLAVAADGSISGTPSSADAGVNTFTLRVTDAGGLYAEATLNITIQKALPAAWTAADIGSVGIAGSSYENHDSAGTYTITAAGEDIWGTSDQFHFASQSLSGDGEIRARVVSQTNTYEWAKAGIMIRNTSDPSSTQALLAITPAHGFAFQYRAAAASESTHVNGPALNTNPNNWVRLTKCGDTITAYSSADGSNWSQVGAVTINMSGGSLFGLAVTSHVNSVTGTAVFDNVSVTPYPSPWLTSDIGSPGVAGLAEYFGGAHTIRGAGAFGGTTDSFRYVYQTLSGNGSIIARVSTLQNTGTTAGVGIMMRESLAINSRMAALTVNGGGSFRWQRRTTSGGNVSTTTSGTGTAPNIWVRLVRSNNTVTASRSANGTSWTTIGSATVNMSSICYIGLAVASGATGTLNTSVMDNLTVVP